jgi:hypothetical protein
MKPFHPIYRVLILVLALALVACGQRQAEPTPVPTAEPTAVPIPTEETQPEPTEMPPQETDAVDDEVSQDRMQPEPLMLDGTAPGLRVVLNRLLSEHVLLAASATEAALDGRSADFEAAAASLDVNSVAISQAIGAVYGDEAGDAFLALWRSHIDFFVDYTVATAGGDEPGRQAAVADLTQYAEDFAAFLAGANPHIDPEAVARLLGEHVTTLAAVVDAQADGDQAAAYTALREANAHMSHHAQALAVALSTQFPDLFTGEATSAAADLRVALNNLLFEHTFLAAMATDAALDGRQAEFEAAAAALFANSDDLGAAIGSIYGADAEAAFIPLWNSHIGFFVDYTLGAANDDQAAKDAAIDDQLGYRADFIAFLNSANPALTEDVVSPILTPHVTTLTSVIDEQAANRPNHAYANLRQAYAHMQMVGDPLVAAIVAQFPDMFGEMAMGHDHDHMDVTSATGATDLRIALTNLLGEHVLLAASATGAALDGRMADFEAAAAALDENSVDLANAVGAIYGDDAGEAFLPLWRSHIDFFVNYTVATAQGDENDRQAAVADLVQYSEDFAAFLAGANPHIDPDAVQASLMEHVVTLAAVVDAQAEADYEMAFTALRKAYAHMPMTALALADATARHLPEQFPGDAAAPAADLRTALNQLLAEHTYLAAMATDAALGGREAEFGAAAAALDANSVDLAAAVGSIYGRDAGDAFLPLWRSHIDFFVNYTVGVATDDDAMKEGALQDLLDYRADFAAFLTGANPNLTTAGLSDALTPHVGTLIAVINAQAEGDAPLAYSELREAYAHMQMIADALAEAIVQQFPAHFE